jgi:stage II sporulation protein D
MRPLLGALLCALLFARPAGAQPNPEYIRVAVVKSEPEVSLQIFGRFAILGRQSGKLIQEGRRLPATPVRAVARGIAFGPDILPVTGVRIASSSDAAISLNGRRLRGNLEIMKQKDGTLLVINHIILEDYLRGVLSKEAPDYWPPEALKAIAIAARTYAIYQRFTKGGTAYDLTGDVLSQDYGGKSEEKAATSRMVKASSGIVLLSGGRLFPTFYHSTCGGVTEHARVMGDFDVPALDGGIICTYCSASPFFRWQRRLTRADISWALSKSPRGSIGGIRSLFVTKRTESQRAQEITITGSKRIVRMTGFEFRQLFGFDRLRSPLFTVKAETDGYVLDGRGWGHGVGMCQWGAAELARRGFSAAEILSYYYPGTELSTVRELAARPVEVIKGGLPN